MPHTLVFVDLPTPDPSAAARFYRDVMGWEVEGRPEGVFHRIVPGGEFPGPDGEPSGVSHLHLGIFRTDEPRPDPTSPTWDAPAGSAPAPRVYVLVDSLEEQHGILSRAVAAGATELWRDHYWREFDGWHASFRDPWGSQLILWSKPDESNPAPADAPY